MEAGARGPGVIKPSSPKKLNHEFTAKEKTKHFVKQKIPLTGANKQFQLGLRVKGERSVIISFGLVRET